MKKLLSVCMLAMSICLSLYAQDKEDVLKKPKEEALKAPKEGDRKAPEIVFETKIIDYGTIEVGSDGVREVTFKNTGKKPLIITSCKGSCGCTVPSCPKEPVKPRKSGVIKVKYNTSKLGRFTKTITVISNAKTPRTVLTIQGNVVKKAKPAE